VARLSLQILDGLVDAGACEASEADREALWAACRLHDVGMAIDYDDHHKHSHYLITRSGLPGFTPREVILIACVARWHRKGAPDPEALAGVAEKGDAARLELLCGVIRLAEQLERSRDGSVRAVHVSAENGRVCLSPETVPGGDPSVALWSARRNSALLAGALDRELEIAG